MKSSTTLPTTVPGRRPVRATRRLSVFLGCGLALLGGSAARAQGPNQGMQLPPKSYMNKNVVYLPVIIDDRVRGQLREIQLYTKDHPARPWKLLQQAPPTQSVFPYRPAQDGEYWFMVVTVDRQGRQTPQDLAREGPGVIVVYDSQMPQVEVRPLPSGAEGQLVQCEVRDSNLDPSKTRFEYQTADKVWRHGEVVPGRPNVFCVPQQAAHNGMVKVTAADRAGNVTVREINLSSATAGLNLPDQAAPPQGGLQQAVHHPGPVLNLPSDAPAPASPRMDPKVEQAVAHAAQRVESGPPAPLPAAVPAAERPVQVEGRLPPPRTSSSVPGSCHVVGNTHITLEYQIEQAGASGVGKVEVWVTRDKGQNWQRLGEDPDRRSPVEIDLPGEGVYGVSLVVSNGRGFGGSPPAPGESPDWWIEVDVTKPFVELASVRPGAGEESAALHITWNARDKNLGSEPVDLFFAVNREGPWTPIAKGIKNEGRYRWMVPQEIGPLAFLRVAVKDRAGNLATAETPQAVALDDLSRPRARVVGVAPNAPRPAPPTGN